MMKSFFTIILFWGLTFCSSAGEVFNPNLKGFSQETLEAAMTNSPVAFMSGEEQKVVFYMNLVRLEPQVFLEQILKPYVAAKQLNVNGYVKSLYSDLQKATPTHPFVMKPDLYQVAQSHAEDIGLKGLTGHTGSHGKTFKKRVNHLFDAYLTVSENVGLGFESPLDNVMGLLIDDGVKDLGHRKAMLSTEYNCIGVSLQNHKKFEFGCVMDFGQMENL